MGDATPPSVPPFPHPVPGDVWHAAWRAYEATYPRSVGAAITSAYLAGRAQAAADIRNEAARNPNLQIWSAETEHVIDYCARLAEGGGEADLSNAPETSDIWVATEEYR